MDLIERNVCAVTGTDDLEPVYTFPDFPVFMGCTKAPVYEDLKADMSWWISRSSGLIQLKQLIPLEILYPESHGAGSVGSLWQKHHKAFADFIYSFKPSSVFEIGGHHGILANYYNLLEDIPWTILEPNPINISQTKARFIKGFFDGSFQVNDSFDAIVHSHVFEHIYTPSEFMEHLSNFVEEGKLLAFSVPNLMVHMKKRFTYCLGFEHTVFLTDQYIEYLLPKYGFRIIKKENFLEDHSVFYSAIKTKNQPFSPLANDLYNRNRELFLDYISYHQELVGKLNAKFNSCEKPIFLFGAHALSQFLLAFGLDSKRVMNLLDNDPNKQEKRLYGTKLFVKSPKILKDIKNPVVILKSGVFNEEIKQDIQNNINSNVEFWE
ncbi:MAG: methyltransferase domain-containing protein [Candidatus Riflebacteria bacterium]|nr:methyltransferase domain-containing protein [Candidatus Riflebacteria bacterium]